jgi:hypothetical protein
MSIRDGWTVQEALVAFDEHLRRVRGVCAGTRRNYARFAGAFLQAVFPDGLVVVERVGVNDVIDFVAAAARRYRPATVELAATGVYQ